MTPKALIIIAVITLLVFGNSLFNGFVGDDEAVIVKNPFYQSGKNIVRLFTSDYTTDSNAVLNLSGKDFHSGSVAYRPVLSLTFFLDYFFWKLNPFGYHLQNLFWHLANAILVFFIVRLTIKNDRIALLSAILFSVHPLKSEAVCSIGYRADSLACFFMLSSFICYMRIKDLNSFSRSVTASASYVLFFLALFAKESAIIFPALIIAYDHLIERKSFKEIARRHSLRYVGYVAIAFIYLYVYLKIFPNSTLKTLSWLGGTLQTHMTYIFHIFSFYLLGLIFPWGVKTLPPVYSPAINVFWGYETWAMIAIFVFVILWAIKFYQKDKPISFFLVWFLICFIPVSNIIPIVNPVAHRFMYFPSIGWGSVMVLLFFKYHQRLDAFIRKAHVSRIIGVGFIAICIVKTFTLNFDWNNNYTMARRMVQNYPQNPTGYLFLGREYYNRGFLPKAKAAIMEGIAKGLDDPRAYHLLGLCSIRNWKETQNCYVTCVSKYPQYAPCLTGLGRFYLLEGQLEKASHFLNKSIEVSPQYSTYAYLIQIYLMQGHRDKAEALRHEAQKEITQNGYLNSLSKFFVSDVTLFPIDIGI